MRMNGLKFPRIISESFFEYCHKNGDKVDSVKKSRCLLSLLADTDSLIDQIPKAYELDLPGLFF
jgi:hypothetical protein